jgi:hypothetical protein
MAQWEAGARAQYRFTWRDASTFVERGNRLLLRRDLFPVVVIQFSRTFAFEESTLDRGKARPRSHD